jgi:hypothetical protein
MTDEQIHQLVQEYMRQSLTEVEHARATRPQRTVEDIEREWLEEQEAEAAGLAPDLTPHDIEEDFFLEAFHCNNFTPVHEVVQAWLKRKGLVLDSASIEYKRLCRELLRASIALVRINRARDHGDYSDGFARPWHGGGKAGESSQAAVPPSMPFSEATKRYFKDLELKLAPATKTRKEVIFNAFRQSLGDDRPIREITHEDTIKFRDTLKERVGHNTVNTKLRYLGGFFQWAAKHHYIPKGSSPTDGIAYEGVKAEHYKPFTDEELKKLFCPAFAQQKSKHPGRYWLKLILAYVGALSGEIGQLAVSDVQCIEGVWFFAVAPDQERGTRLKNEYRTRHIPVHSDLIKLGLLEYVEQRKVTGDVLLLPKGGRKAVTCASVVSQ